MEPLCAESCASLPWLNILEYLTLAEVAEKVRPLCKAAGTDLFGCDAALWPMLCRELALTGPDHRVPLSREFLQSFKRLPVFGSLSTEASFDESSTSGGFEACDRLTVEEVEAKLLHCRSDGGKAASRVEEEAKEAEIRWRVANGLFDKAAALAEMNGQDVIGYENAVFGKRIFFNLPSLPAPYIVQKSIAAAEETATEPSTRSSTRSSIRSSIRPPTPNPLPSSPLSQPTTQPPTQPEEKASKEEEFKQQEIKQQQCKQTDQSPLEQISHQHTVNKYTFCQTVLHQSTTDFELTGGPHHETDRYYHRPRSHNCVSWEGRKVCRLSIFGCTTALRYVWWLDFKGPIRLWFSGRYGVYLRMRWQNGLMNGYRLRLFAEDAAIAPRPPHSAFNQHVTLATLNTQARPMMVETLISDRRVHLPVASQHTSGCRPRGTCTRCLPVCTESYDNLWTDVCVGAIDVEPSGKVRAVSGASSDEPPFGVPLQCYSRVFFQLLNTLSRLKTGVETDFAFVWPVRLTGGCEKATRLSDVRA